MAFRKETVKQRIDEAVRPLLEPGENVEVSAFAVKGPSPYLIYIFEEVIPFGEIVAYATGLHRPYFVVLTDRRLIFIKVSLWRTMGRGLAFADPREGLAVDGFKPGRQWTALKLRRPGGNALRLNFHWRRWREEGEAMHAALANRPS